MDSSKSLDQNIEAAVDLVLKSIVLPPGVDRSDLAQEAQVAIRTGIAEGKFDAAHPKAFNWLCQTARHQALDCLRLEDRQSGRRQATTPADLDSLPAITHRNPRPSDTIPDSQSLTSELEALSRAISELPPLERTIVSLSYLDGLSVLDIARKLRYTKHYVVKKLQKSLEILRTKLALDGIVW